MQPTLLRPKNWATFQHYKDRSPPWIKLHRALLDDFDYASLPLASKALAPLLWLLAAEAIDGHFTGEPARLAHRLRWTMQDIVSGLTPLIHKGFFEVASGVLADCLQHACPETETEAETQKPKSRSTVRTSSAPSRFPEFWSVYPNKKGKQEAEARWKKSGLDGMADQLIAHVLHMRDHDNDWKRGYAPMGSTYLNGARWEDEAKAAPAPEAKGPSARMSKLLLLGDDHEMDGRRNQNGVPKAGLLGFGTGTGSGSDSWDGDGLGGVIDFDQVVGRIP